MLQSRQSNRRAPAHGTAADGLQRTALFAPLLQKNHVIGSLVLYRQEVCPFGDKQIALVENFAAQAVIAIENARLLNELRQRTTDLTERTADLTEALDQQTATSEVLQVISSSPGNLEPVFQAMLENATRICEAKFGVVFSFDGSQFHFEAQVGTPPEFAEYLNRARPMLQPLPGSHLDRLKQTKRVSYTADYAAEGIPAPPVTLGGARSTVDVPMLKDNELVGAFSIYRQEVRPFTEKQIDLVKNFAAQAVIAIENARLLNELRQRTDDLTERTSNLTEALDQQTATSEVLQVISSTPGDLQPVFATMLENAVRICDATFGNIYRWDGEALHMLASHNTPPAFAEDRRRSPYRPYPNSPIGRMVANKTVVHISDVRTEDVYTKQLDPVAVTAVTLGGLRTLLGVPLLNKSEMIGAFFLSRQEVRPFTDKQIELVKNFAAQAVIAIENARLLSELRQRTTDLSEALEQQTATSDVLKVIANTQGELEPVFDAILANATRICEAELGTLVICENDGFRHVAGRGLPPDYVELRKREPVLRPPNNAPLGRLAANKQAVHVVDLLTEPARGQLATMAGSRTQVLVPLLNDDRLIGAMVVFRKEVRPFTDKQIDLLKNFAAQAVIAIENARLLDELRQRTSDLTESLEQQTATSNVLEVISRSAFDLRAVFETVAESAVKLCGADRAVISRFDGTLLRIVAAFNTSPEMVGWLERNPIRPGRHAAAARAALERRTIYIPDVLADPEYTFAGKDIDAIRSVLGVPILKGEELLGVLIIYHLEEVRPFTDKQIAVVETFADQAAIAIENTRLLDELRERTDEVEKLNLHLEHRVSDQVGEIERMSRLRRFLPPQVADLIVASGTEKQLESHRREITALFCDLRGFTGFTESADAEDVIALLREYHAAVGEKIIKYSGTLERYAGDGVMVVFNDPVPVENPALQAVLMALEMREAIGALTETWHRWGHDIGFGIGIAHGFATLGTIGFEGRFDYAAIGTVSNVASRLCDEAKPGQILISPRVLTKVENAVTVEPVGEFELKGIRRPLAAYNVVATVS